ncbi:NUDIX domain-containing protein [Kitasatospora sp. NPDC004240]
MNEPTHRLGCLVLLRNQHGELLLTTPPGLSGLRLPGGTAEPGEPPHEAAARHLYALTGLPIRPNRVLAVDWSQSGRLTLVLDGGAITTATATPPGTRLVRPADLPNAMSPAQASRTLEALAGGQGVPLLLHGQRAAWQ